MAGNPDALHSGAHGFHTPLHVGVRPSAQSGSLRHTAVVTGGSYSLRLTVGKTQDNSTNTLAFYNNYRIFIPVTIQTDFAIEFIRNSKISEINKIFIVNMLQENDESIRYMISSKQFPCSHCTKSLSTNCKSKSSV